MINVDTKIGFGDLLAALANPIAKISDSILNTNLQNCAKCAERKRKLNALTPSILTLDNATANANSTPAYGKQSKN